MRMHSSTRPWTHARTFTAWVKVLTSSGPAKAWKARDRIVRGAAVAGATHRRLPHFFLVKTPPSAWKRAFANKYGVEAISVSDKGADAFNLYRGSKLMSYNGRNRAKYISPIDIF